VGTWGEPTSEETVDLRKKRGLAHPRKDKVADSVPVMSERISMKGIVGCGRTADELPSQIREARMNVNAGPMAALLAMGFAVQQLLELLTPILDVDNNPTFQRYKKGILGASSLIVGIIMAYSVPQLRVLKILGVSSASAPLDVFVTGLMLSAGTDGVNSVLKLMKYSKEDKKSTVAAKEFGFGGTGEKTANSAMQRLNRI